MAVFDYDGDGRMDLYFASYQFFDPRAPRTGPNRLYRNLGEGRFEDRTAEAGVGYVGFCHGLIVGDADNDGDPDLVLCNHGPNVFYRNNGDGTFSDETVKAGLNRPGWSSGGRVPRPRSGRRSVTSTSRITASGSSPRTPRSIAETPSRARGSIARRATSEPSSTFFTATTETEPSPRPPRRWGWPEAPPSAGYGFGVVAADLDDNGTIDLYVANDMNPNFLFLNNGDGTFHDATEEAGTAYDDKGNAQSGMGVDAEDVDGRRPARAVRDELRQRVQHALSEPRPGPFLRSDPLLRLRRRQHALGRLGLRPDRLRQ